MGKPLTDEDIPPRLLDVCRPFATIIERIRLRKLQSATNNDVTDAAARNSQGYSVEGCKC